MLLGKQGLVVVYITMLNTRECPNSLFFSSINHTFFHAFFYVFFHVSFHASFYMSFYAFFSFLQPSFNLNLHLYTMSFPCSICHKNLRSPGGLKKHVHLKHLKSSTLTGKAEAAKKHTFIRHPHLSGKSESISLLV